MALDGGADGLDFYRRIALEAPSHLKTAGLLMAEVGVLQAQAVGALFGAALGGSVRVIRDLCGHGIGREMHEEPDVPNFGKPGRGIRLEAGMTIAIEPMIAKGRWPVYIGSNGWTVITRDHSLASHYEHTIAVTTGEPEILTFPGANLREAIR